jgi:hypothetical protein
MKNSTVMVGKTSRSEVQVETFVEVANLFESFSFLGFFDQDRSSPCSVIAAAGAVCQFDNPTRVTGAREFVSRGETGDAGAEQDDFLARARALRKLGRAGPRFRKMDQSERSHRLVKSDRAACDTHSFEKMPARNTILTFCH